MRLANLASSSTTGTALHDKRLSRYAIPVYLLIRVNYTSSQGLALLPSLGLDKVIVSTDRGFQRRHTFVIGVYYAMFGSNAVPFEEEDVRFTGELWHCFTSTCRHGIT